MLRRDGDVGLHHLEDEEVVLGHQRVVVEPTLEAGVALADDRRVDLLGVLRRQAEVLELVEVRPRGVADAHDRVRQRGRGEVDDARAALANHPEAVVTA